MPGPVYLVAASGRLNGLAALDIAGSDVEDLTLALWPGADIPGRIRLDGRGPGDGDDVSGLLVTLRRHPPVNGLTDPSLAAAPPIVVAPPAAPNATPAAVQAAARPSNRSGRDGTFGLYNVPPGRYLVDVTIRGDLHVQSIHLGGRDVLQEGLYVEGPVEGELEIVVSPRGGSVEEIVSDAARQPAGNVTVVALPEPALRTRHDLYKVATTDGNGRFTLRGLAPGLYELFAWESVEPGVWRDAAFMQPYAGRGRTVRIAAGGRSGADLTLLASQP